ncbi:hypothetical protein M569_06962, partial [Genlisea aurea]
AAASASAAAAAASSSAGVGAESLPEDLAAKAVHKRYEGLVMVRTKAIKGKGAWYWAHLEPILVSNAETGLAKAVKLRCSLCDAVFSASNPSRTASEHLMRGTCPNFSSTAKPISSVPSSSAAALVPVESINPAASSSSQKTHRKRNSGKIRGGGGGESGNSGGILTAFSSAPPAVDPSRFPVDLACPPTVSASVPSASAGAATFYGHQQQQLVLSGGKEDLDALAKLEDSVKRLKSPKPSPGQTLTKSQIESAFDFLADWVYECSGTGAVSLSALDHPKFKDFLHHVGLPPSVPAREFSGSKLDAKYEETRIKSEAKIREAMFFQIASNGWKPADPSLHPTDESLVHISLNLPNGSTVFRRVVFTSGYVPSKYAEEILWDTITDICGNGGGVHQCVGIVSDKFKNKALKTLENRHQWMVNLSCQHQGFISLIKDFSKDLHLFRNVTENCFKLGSFINGRSQIRRTFRKYQLQEYGHASSNLLRLAARSSSDFTQILAMVEDVLTSARALHLVLVDESFKTASIEEQIPAREFEELMRNPHFWNDLEAVHSLIKLVKSMAQEIETDKSRIGQCLPLWEELRIKIREWCSKFQIPDDSIYALIEKRFNKNYHPAWAAAFILDPLYLIRDATGKYIPPFKYLTPEQEKDVDQLIRRLVPREEAPIALMELMKWRMEGLDPVYAQAVQLKQRDPNTLKMKVANPQSSRLVWETYLTDFKSLGKVAIRLIFLHASSSSSRASFRWGSSLVGWVRSNSNSRSGMERVQKLMFVSAHCKQQQQRGTSSAVNDNDDKDAEMFGMSNGEDDVMNDVFDASSV